VCVECLIGKQKKPILFKVTEPSSVPYRTPPVRQMAAYPDPPPVILLPESIAAQAAYQLRYKNTEYYSWVSSGPKCFQVLGLSPSLLYVINFIDTAEMYPIPIKANSEESLHMCPWT